MAGQPKAPFYIAVALVVVGLIGFAAWRSDLLAPEGNEGGDGQNGQVIDPQKLGIKKQASEGGEVLAEEADSGGLTTVKEYSFRPSERLPKITGTSAYRELEDNTIRFALNVWAGWGPIILANEGHLPGKEWKTPDGKTFKVELVLIDDPVAMRNAYAAGEVHIGWATLDMVPLFMEGFVDSGDSRVMPRIYQQVDWSNGGDGIVVRKNIKTVADLRGKTLVLAQNSPSQYFALNMLVAGGVQPSEVDFQYTTTAFEAAAAFASDPNIAGAVSWAPDIYKLSEVEGNRMLVTTATANKLIADVWFARADFAKDHPGIIEGLVRGIFDGMESLKKPESKERCAELMAELYSIPESAAMEMFADAHNTNWAENYQFFMNQNNPTNFERVWKQAYYLYKQIGSIQHQPVPFDQVMDFSIIEKLGKEEKYQAQRDEYRIQLAPKSVSSIQAESDEILTNTVYIHFYPNSWDLEKKVERDGEEVPYDPNVKFTLDEIARLTEQFGAGRVVIEGHADSSMRGTVPESVVQELSLNRANAVKQAIVQKYELDPNKFSAAGLGWTRPADPSDPKNQAKNRRVEVKVYPAEAQ